MTVSGVHVPAASNDTGEEYCEVDVIEITGPVPLSWMVSPEARVHMPETTMSSGGVRSPSVMV